MTDKEIIDIMYDHANGFSSCIQFSEEGVLNFARAIIDASTPKTSTPKVNLYQQHLDSVLRVSSELDKHWRQ